MVRKKKFNKRHHKTFLVSAGAILVLLISITIIYAALSTTLNITINRVSQNALTWNVAFSTGSVTPTVGGTGDAGRSCGTATVDATTVTVANTTLSKPEDSCTYQLTINNTGSIDAKLGTITPVHPSSTNCTDSGASMVCGNITYKLATNSTGTTLLATNSTIANTTGTQTVYLIIKYTGATTSNTSTTQSSGGFTLVYNQN